MSAFSQGSPTSDAKNTGQNVADPFPTGLQHPVSLECLATVIPRAWAYYLMGGQTKTA